ncbi:MAG: HYR domain-containing protein, partial [Moheibacter sp.]
GVWVDNIVVEGVFAEDPTTTQIEGLPSGSDFPVGTTTNTFQVTDANGNSTTCSFDVIVDDGIAPEINCPDDKTVEIPVGTTYTLPDYWTDGEVTANDACSDIVNQAQYPSPGTELAPGVHNIIFTVQDVSENMVDCMFQLTVEEVMAVSDAEFADLITIYPNPTDNLVKISNQTNEIIKKIILTDLSGKQVQEFNINNGKNENTISVRHLSSGTYILLIVSDRNTVIKKLIKK